MSEPPEPPKPPEPAQFPQPSSCETGPAQGRSGGSLLRGLLTGTFVYVAVPALSLLGGTQGGYFGIFWIVLEIVVTIVVIFAGIGMVANRDTRLTGAGVFLSLALGIIVTNGVCIGLTQVLAS
jgi:hypothetical protein